jgi:cell division protein FtsN
MTANPAPAKPVPVIAAPAKVAPPPTAAPKPVALTPKPAPKPAAAPPKSVTALIQQANAVPEPAPARPLSANPSSASPPPVLKQSMTSTTAAPAPLGGPATAGPRQLGIATATPAPTASAAPPPAPAKPAAGGSYVLQIGAYTSQGDADAAWKAYKARHAGLLSGYSDDVQQADLGPKGTWYRLRIGGLSDKQAASALCDRLKADGGACILGR